MSQISSPAHAGKQNYQLDVLPREPAPTHDLIGPAVTTPTACRRCHGKAATIGAGRAMHMASLMCACGLHRGWISQETFNFISETVKHFGRPTEPIEVRFGKTATTPGG